MKKLLLTLGIAIASYCSFAQTAIPPILYNSTTQVISSQPASATQDGHLLSTDWNIFNGKQNALNGTGILSFSGTTPSYLLSTGSGDLVKATSPTLITPILGVASASNILLSNTTPTTPTGSNTAIFGGNNFFRFVGNNGFAATLASSTLTANQSYILPNISTTLAGNSINNAFTVAQSMPSLNITGTGGNGYISLGANGATSLPTPLTGNTILFSGVLNNALSFKGLNTFAATFTSSYLTATQIMAIPNVSGFIMTNPLTTAGDIPYLSANSTTGTNVSRLGIGATGQILTVSGGIPTWSSNINANLGIGTASPAAKLDVTGTAMLGGSSVANLDPAAGSISYVENTGKTLIGWNRSASEGETDFIGNQGLGTSGGFSFYNHDNSGTETQLIRIKGDGSVGIGTPYPDAKLAVNGTIHTKEVKVDLTGWSDYVFEPAYSLPSLASVKNYINENHHLPEMPSTQEVMKNGVNLGEMVNLQTKKIEELTLYLIEKDKQLVEQNEKLAHQNKQLSEQSQQLSEQDKTNQLLQTTLSQMEARLKALETK